jgi:hypothetical protein
MPSNRSKTLPIVKAAVELDDPWRMMRDTGSLMGNS